MNEFDSEGFVSTRRDQGALPAYMQIAELLSREISAGIWPDGSRLPTEAQLATTLGVAVGTLRKGLRILEERGLLERIQGSGTYVRRKAKTGAIYEFLRLELKSGVGLPRASIVSLDKLARPDFLPPFGDGSSQTAWRVRRLRYLGQTPAALEEIWFDARHDRRLRIESVNQSMHLFYREKLGFWIARAEDRVSLAPCPDWSPDPDLFKPGHAMGYVERISWGNGGMIEEFSRNWFDPEKVAYVGRLDS